MKISQEIPCFGYSRALHASRVFVQLLISRKSTNIHSLVIMLNERTFHFGYSTSCDKFQTSFRFHSSKALRFHEAEHADVYKDSNAFIVKKNREAPSGGKISLEKKNRIGHWNADFTRKTFDFPYAWPLTFRATERQRDTCIAAARLAPQTAEKVGGETSNVVARKLINAIYLSSKISRKLT